MTLFTRPRRFSKTLNMSMLKYFFQIGADPHLFDGLYITKRKDLCEQYMGKYPVIFLSLKSVEGMNFDEAKIDALLVICNPDKDKIQCIAVCGINRLFTNI